MTRLDSLELYSAAIAMCDQVVGAVERARDVRGLPDASLINNVVVAGMGTSGLAGDLLQAVAGPLASVPVHVVKTYECPAFVGSSTLFIAVSYSGNTEETVACAIAARAAGAHIVVVAAGGALQALAAQWDAPFGKVDASLPSARSALGALAIPPIAVLDEIGLMPGARRGIRAVVDQLRLRRDECMASDGGPAALLARRIGRTIPILHGGEPLGAVAALRWKTQINENAKCPAFVAVQPDLCHNELVGWGQHGDATRQLMTLVALRHSGEHMQTRRRFDFTAEALREVYSDVIEVAGEGDGLLAEFFDLAFLGDLVSLHLAFNEGLDPGPSPIVDSLKATLSPRPS